LKYSRTEEAILKRPESEAGGRLYVGLSGSRASPVIFFVDAAGTNACVVAFNTDITAGAPNTQTLDRELEDFVL
jgi:hypothetical protein